MRYAVEMGSSKFHKDWFRRSEVNSWGFTDTHREHGDIISLLLFIFFQNKKVG
jgi:hypothetical protein